MLAFEVARRLGDIELVSADSMQVYRGMDIGTAKPTHAERSEVAHHLIDLVDPWDDFTVSEFQAQAAEAIADIEARGHRALLIGGTGLYVQAVVDGLQIPGRWAEVRAELEREPDTVALHRRLRELDPLAAGRMEATNRRRVLRALEVTLGSGRPFSSFGPGIDAFPTTRFDLVGIRLPSPVVQRRIAARYQAQVDAGFVDEVRRLAALPGNKTLSRTAAQALGYKELLSHVRGECSLEEALGLAIRRTQRFARRQRAWFGRDPRIAWLDASDEPGEVLPTLLHRWRNDRRQSTVSPRAAE
jgi:tRNA dimethylallyltransferase